MAFKVRNERKYSGPGNSGICKCGCRWDEHHLGVVLNPEYVADTGEGYVAQECDAFGFNERGGMKQDEDGDWKYHCSRYEDRGMSSDDQILENTIGAGMAGDEVKSVYVHKDGCNGRRSGEACSCFYYKLSAKVPDMVNSPPHYSRLNPQPIDVVEAWGLNHHLATALTYISRAGFKGSEIEDIEKSIWYLQRRIVKLKKEQNEAKETQPKKQ